MPLANRDMFDLSDAYDVSMLIIDSIDRLAGTLGDDGVGDAADLSALVNSLYDDARRIRDETRTLVQSTRPLAPPSPVTARRLRTDQLGTIADARERMQSVIADATTGDSPSDLRADRLAHLAAVERLLQYLPA